MLVLSRKVGEKLMIGEGISITVVEISGNRVRIGVVADRDIPVHRQEVYDQIQLNKEKQRARSQQAEARGVEQPEEHRQWFGAGSDRPGEGDQGG